MTQDQAAIKSKPNLFLLSIAVLGYSTISIAVVYYNFWLFQSFFKHPVFISWWQQIIGFIGFMIFGTIGRKVKFLGKAFPENTISLKKAIKLSPVGIFFILWVATSNLCLKHTLISTYMVARSCTLLFVLLLSYLILKKKESWFVVISCFTMAAGFAIGSFDPTTLSLLGLLYGGVSSLFQAIYNVNIKKYLAIVQNDSQVLLFYNMFLSSVLFIPFVLGLEGTAPFKEAFNPQNNLLKIWMGIIGSGLMCTAMNMFQFLVIRITNPVASNIIGLTKSLIQTMGGFILFHDPMTTNSLAGISLSLLGSAMYAGSKSKDYLQQNKIKNIAVPPPTNEKANVQMV